MAIVQPVGRNVINMPGLLIGANGLPITATGGGGAHTVNAGSASANPEQGAAALTRAQYSYFLDKAKPHEDLAIADITNPNMPGAIANAAEARVNKTHADLKGLEERAVQPYGVRLNSTQSKQIDRRRGLEHALGVVSARNGAYNATSDFQLDASSDALQIGRGVAGQASRDLSSAAKSFTVARDQQEAQKAQKKSNTMSTVMTAAGIGMSAAGALGIGSLAAGTAAASAAGAGLGASIGLLAAFI